MIEPADNSKILARSLILLNSLAFIMAFLFSSQLEWELSYLLVLGIVLVIPSVLFILNKPHIALGFAVVGNFAGIWGQLFPQAELFTLSLFQLFFLLTLFLIYLQIQQSSFPAIPFHAQYIWIALFFLLLIVSSIYSEAKEKALYLSLTFGVLVLFAHLVSGLFKKSSHMRILFETIVVLTIGLALMAIYQFISDPLSVLLNSYSGYSKIFGRQLGSYDDPNIFGLLIVFPIFYLCTRLFVLKDSFNKISGIEIYHVIALGILFAGLLSTYSRSAWLATITGIMALFLITGRWRKLFILFGLSVVVLSIFSITSEIFFKAIISRILSVTNVTTNVSNSARIVLAEAGLEMFHDSYWLGFGFMSYNELAPAYFDTTLTLGVVAPHNILVQLLAEVGIIGCLLFIAAMLSFLKLGISLSREITPNHPLYIYLVVATAYLLSLLIFYQLYPGCLHNNLLWFCIGLILLTKNSREMYIE